MAETRRIKGISARTTKLLREGEGEQCDFKRAPESVSTDDLVAFANSEAGGSLLAGVDERTGLGGIQVGHVVGCDVSDAAILQVANKALSCFPPIAIEVSIENLGQMPFLRIDVPSSPTKPHCTARGTYCRRDGSRNRPLHPSELLKMFLESESRAFAERFEAAAGRITRDLSQLEEVLGRSIQDMGSKLGWAGYQLDDTESRINSILAHVQTLGATTGDLAVRLRAIFRQDNRQDPVRDRHRKKILDMAVEELLNEKLIEGFKAGRQLTASVQGTQELTQDEIAAVLQEAVKIATARLEQEKQKGLDEQQK